MFILVRLAQHVSSIIMLIVRRTDYTKKTACGECLQPNIPLHFSHNTTYSCSNFVAIS